MAEIRVEEKRGSLAWLWVLILVLIVAVVAWFLLGNRDAGPAAVSPAADTLTSPAPPPGPAMAPAPAPTTEPMSSRGAGMDSVSLGPDLRGVHSTAEACSISSTQRVAAFLRHLLVSLR